MVKQYMDLGLSDKKTKKEKQISKQSPPKRARA